MVLQEASLGGTLDGHPDASDLYLCILAVNTGLETIRFEDIQTGCGVAVELVHQPLPALHVLHIELALQRGTELVPVLLSERIEVAEIIRMDSQLLNVAV